MSKRRPNGGGSIVFCKGRAKPYKATAPAVFSPDHCNENGNVVPVRAFLGYFGTYNEAAEALAAFTRCPFNVLENPTFGDVFRLFLDKKRKAGKSQQLITSYNSAFQRCGYIADKLIRKIQYIDLLRVLDGSADKSRSTVNNILVVIKGTFALALKHRYIATNPAEFIEPEDVRWTAPTQPKHRALTDEEIISLLTAPRDIIVDLAVIQLHSGWRPEELLQLNRDDCNLQEGYFRGGLKTAAGKNRLIPIHSAIQGIVREYYESAPEGGKLFAVNYDHYYRAMRKRYTFLPHDLRHSFISRLQTAGADHICLERIAGHSSKGITDSVYTHKDVQELRANIELLDYTHLLAGGMKNAQ